MKTYSIYRSDQSRPEDEPKLIGRGFANKQVAELIAETDQLDANSGDYPFYYFVKEIDEEDDE